MNEVNSKRSNITNEMTEFPNLTLKNSIRNWKFGIRNSRTRGFTLIELLVVITIMSSNLFARAMSGEGEYEN